MSYPEDREFEEAKLSEVRLGDSGWDIKRDDGWSFWVPSDSPVVPKVGMMVRFYGRGVGYPVRGLYVDGRRVYYRTQEEDRKHQAALSYGEDSADWLRRWDDGRSVWSIEMGGLGPGYEQAIQITMAEVLRHLLEKKYDDKAWSTQAVWDRDRKEIEEVLDRNPTVKELGLSGAQWGAAVHLATQFYRKGPQQIMADERVSDRKIQVTRTFPGSSR